MRNTFEASEVAEATVGKNRWNDFYMNLKRSGLMILPPRSRGVPFSFAHALECEFQRRIGSRFNRWLAKRAFLGVLSHIRDETGLDHAALERSAEVFDNYAAERLYLVFTPESSEDPTIFIVTDDLTEIDSRIRRVAVGAATDPRSVPHTAEVSDHLIVINASSIIASLAVKLGA